MNLKNLIFLIICASFFGSCRHSNTVTLNHGIDKTAGGGEAYIITTSEATYYLEKEGGGLSSMIDKDSIDWIGFHNEKGSGHKGEYRGFPNAVHKQDGSYFHPMNAGTNPSTSVVEIEKQDHVRITFASDNKKWEGIWDFYSDRCDFTMSKISPTYRYWVQYEGVPGGEMDSTDYWINSVDERQHPIQEPYLNDLPNPEWIAFGDRNFPRVIYLLHHANDTFPDNYVHRPDMTVLGFGRENKNKFLTTKQTFSIGFIESNQYSKISQSIKNVLK